MRKKVVDFLGYSVLALFILGVMSVWLWLTDSGDGLGILDSLQTPLRHVLKAAVMLAALVPSFLWARNDFLADLWNRTIWDETTRRTQKTKL